MANIETGLSDKDHYGKHLKELINQGKSGSCMLPSLNNTVAFLINALCVYNMYR